MPVHEKMKKIAIGILSYIQQQDKIINDLLHTHTHRNTYTYTHI